MNLKNKILETVSIQTLYQSATVDYELTWLNLLRLAEK